ncbi:hypothetical protein KAFR_0C05790 [Kazachstania africana CBS 2517]|uniref:Uncharacterized protein n=1 Tax=Kazachstania africana (strain ATCC 22294 / BCRC 22015 / CBS 2517 / CECT 1963 / NBRC 1671 / NRRL Y-8276) TaxID=1071382 RepID=H2AT70_KAZAF|nr:hypothetical protein KAFR_0C05790 [Kazachstania africana CBS 2517]CCF57570.1 hypothetical protein KAFR_0C05790 [Kazachstania africana CBS 2517]
MSEKYSKERNVSKPLRDKITNINHSPNKPSVNMRKREKSREEFRGSRKLSKTSHNELREGATKFLDGVSDSESDHNRKRKIVGDDAFTTPSKRVKKVCDPGNKSLKFDDFDQPPDSTSTPVLSNNVTLDSELRRGICNSHNDMLHQQQSYMITNQNSHICSQIYTSVLVPCIPFPYPYQSHQNVDAESLSKFSTGSDPFNFANDSPLLNKGPRKQPKIMPMFQLNQPNSPPQLPVYYPFYGSQPMQRYATIPLALTNNAGHAEEIAQHENTDTLSYKSSGGNATYQYSKNSKD